MYVLFKLHRAFFKTGFSLDTVAEKDEIHICVLYDICKQFYQILDNAMFMIILKKKTLEMDGFMQNILENAQNILNSFGYSWRHYLGDSLAMRFIFWNYKVKLNLYIWMYVHSNLKNTRTRNWKKTKKTMAFKMLIIAIIKVTIPFFLICQEEINVLQIVLYSWWMPIMRNVSFIIRVNMNCTMFYMEVLYCIKNV